MVGMLKFIWSLLLDNPGGDYNAKDEVENAIAEHKKLYKHSKKLIDTITHSHSQAYIKAVDEHLRDDKGQVDFDKLDDTRLQDKFADTMKDFYIEKARDYLKVSGGDLDEVQKNMLMQAYSGISDSALRDQIRKSGSDFTHQAMDSVKANIRRGLEERLYGIASKDLSQEHVEDIIKYVGVANKVDYKLISFEEAKDLLEAHHIDGTISDPTLRRVVGAYKVSKGKAANDNEEKEEHKKAA
jgi:hypothetical protein